MNEELFDIVDTKGTVIGQAPRSECHGNPELIHRSIHVLLWNKEGRLFMQKRSMNKDTEPGKWDTSMGGHVAAGETIEEALERELMEELGIQVCEARPEFLYSFMYTNGFETEMVFTYTTEWNGPIEIQEEEIEQGRFWSREEIEEKLQTQTFTPHFKEEWKSYNSR